MHEDLDVRARVLIREIYRAEQSDIEFLDSSALRGQEQRYPRKALLMEASREIDRILLGQVRCS